MQQSVSIQTQSADGKMINGASCKLQNAKGTWYMTTPGSLVVHRAYGDLSISCKKFGDPFGDATAISSVRGWMFGNIVFGGFIGAGVDLGTGAGFNYPVDITVSGRNNFNSETASSFVAKAPRTAVWSPVAEASRVAPSSSTRAEPVHATATSAPTAAAAPTTTMSPRLAASAPVAKVGQDDSDGFVTELLDVQRNVASGTATMIAAHADWQQPCKTDGGSPMVKMLDAPRHGTLDIKQGTFVAPDGDTPVFCDNGKIHGTQIFYASDPGFHGTDHFRYEIMTATGRFSRVVNIIVE
ncbi:hypothetical protein OVY01_04390 [Robbsia sp. Bb-Pol-6]|uniref:Uncharacterized protein n=1 Tax=Robbsia betulipollinis TaxID=2981849 RepID=A0ABT3ZJH5_9BURK|nr:hypothetical protein [Robbsia betulipollinis]MCY0386492.1 hypothetical protein [Robbsia betulipollinis]